MTDGQSESSRSFCMLKRTLPTSKTCKVSDQDHKPCSEAFAGQPWYIIEVNPRYEFVCSRDLAKLPFPVDTYVASQQELHRYTNGSKRTVERIVITKRVFVRFPEGQRQSLLTSCPFALRYMMDPALQRNAYGGRSFAQVPDTQLSQLRSLLALAESPVEHSDLSAFIGHSVRVIGGPLLGQEGTVYLEGGKTFLILSFDTLGSFCLQISPSLLIRI